MIAGSFIAQLMYKVAIFTYVVERKNPLEYGLHYGYL